MKASVYKYLSPRNVFLLLGLLFLAQQLFILFSFSFDQFDTDQMLMWEAAMDMSKGHFYTPHFYGQQYNSMAEAFLASPFIFLGLKVYYAVPLATWLMAISPWLILLFYCNKKGLFSSGILILIFLFLLSPQYSILTHMSRGFIQGIFFTFLGLAIWWFGSKKPIHFFFLLLFALLGALQVPNNILLFPAIVILFWDKRWLTKKYLVFGGLAIFLIASIYMGIQQFYISHPENLIHGKPQVHASLDQFMKNIKSVHLLFIHLFRGEENAPFTLLVLALTIGMISKKYWQMGCFLVLVLVSISVNKVADITESVFFSGGRFYMAVPLGLALFLLVRRVDIKPTVILALAFVGVGLGFIQTSELDHDIQTKPWRGKEAPVLSFTLDEINCACDSIQTIAKQSDALIVYDHYFVEAVSLGCPILKKDFPMSSRYRYERRPWIKFQLDAMRPKSLIIMDRFTNPDSVKTLFPDIELKWIEGQAYRMKNKEKQRVDTIMQKWNRVPRT